MPQQNHALGVEQESMKARAFALRFLVATVSGVVAAWYAIASVQVSGIAPSNWSAADVIQQRCPLHLVRPEWTGGGGEGDILLSWVALETKTRLLVVSSLWVVAIAVSLWLALRSGYHGHRA